jgi:serine/threonine protein kinase
MTIIDFGFSKKIGKERTFTFCGTTHAMAPEFFSDQLDE